MSIQLRCSTSQNSISTWHMQEPNAHSQHLHRTPLHLQLFVFHRSAEKSYEISLQPLCMRESSSAYSSDGLIHPFSTNALIVNNLSFWQQQLFDQMK